MSFFEAIKSCFSKYTTFAGTATRSEFWYWVLFIWLGAMIFLYLDAAFFPEKVDALVYPLSSVFNMIIALPTLAVGCRRLHDIGRSGWWQLLSLTILGYFLLLYWWACKRPEKTDYFVEQP